MLAKKCAEIILDNGKLNDTRFDYFVAGASFHVGLYSPHRFSRQFGFYQRLPRVLLDDPHSRAVSCEDTLYYGKRLLFLSSMAQGTLPSHCLTLRKYVSSAYKDWWSKVTINDRRTNVSLLEKSKESNSSRCDKDEEVSSSRKIQGEKGKALMDDFDGKAPESGDIIQGSPGILLMDKK